MFQPVAPLECETTEGRSIFRSSAIVPAPMVAGERRYLRVRFCNAIEKHRKRKEDGAKRARFPHSVCTRLKCFLYTERRV